MRKVAGADSHTEPVSPSCAAPKLWPISWAITSAELVTDRLPCDSPTPKRALHRPPTYATPTVVVLRSRPVMRWVRPRADCPGVDWRQTPASPSSTPASSVSENGSLALRKTMTSATSTLTAACAA